MDKPYQGNGEPMSRRGLQRACDDLDCNENALWALLTVETRGFGYQAADQRPKILFERHVFHRLTGGRYDARRDLSSPQAGGYVGGAAEYGRLEAAARLDQEAALKSASWGLGQIMGFNAGTLKYANASAMVGEFVSSEDAQLDGVCRFIKASPPLHDALRAGQWKKVAFFYNGASYARNEYDIKLQHAYERFSQYPRPDVTVRAIQAYLTYLRFDPRGIDGYGGRNTLDALHDCQQAHGLQQDDVLDDGTVETLRQLFLKSRKR